MMRRLFNALTIGITLWASCFTASALAEEGTAFFRIVSPTAVEITGLSSNGVLTWSNASPGSTCLVQRADSLAAQNGWNDYMRVMTTGPLTSVQLFAKQVAQDMVFIPGGTFHALANQSTTEDFVFLTIWPGQPEPGVNEVYDGRREAWGTTYREI